MKRIAIFLDGTWSRRTTSTNVWRLRELTADADADGVEQIVIYQPGLGATGFGAVPVGLLGLGIFGKVLDAYQRLMRVYEDGDQIFLFGFSRGAYTVRSLAGMIACCGLLRPEGPATLPDIYTRYRRRRQAAPLPELLDQRRHGRTRFGLADQRLLDSSRPVDIEYIGVWDTVGALGVPFGRIRGVSRSTTSFHSTNPSAHYRNMYQAMAIDEHRIAYSPALWTLFQEPDRRPPTLRAYQTLEQRWFVGAHCDVGGGTRANELSRIPLRWIQESASVRGLAFIEELSLAGHEVTGPVSDTFSGFLGGGYRLLQRGRRYYRPIGQGPRPTVTRPGYSWSMNETIDGSVFDRWRANDTYRPPNLREWADRQGVDPAAVHGPLPTHPTGAPSAQLSPTR